MWEDFHNRFMTHAGESLAAQVRPNFFVKLEERVFIHEPTSEERGKFLGKLDIALFDSGTTTEMPVAVVAPAINKVQSIMVSTPISTSNDIPTSKSEIARIGNWSR